VLNFRITECQVLFVQEHKLFLPVASYCNISQKKSESTIVFKQHKAKLFECCCQTQTHCSVLTKQTQ